MAGVAVVITTIVLAAPGLGEVRARLAHASPGWLALAVGFELMSVLSYVLIFRAVFCPRMRWRFSSQIAMSELAANSLLPASGAGGLALGAWALRRGGMDVEQIGRKTVALYFLTSLANVGLLIVFASLYAVGALGENPNPPLTYAFGALAAASVLAVLAIPVVLRGLPQRASARGSAGGRIARAVGLVRRSLVDGVPDAVLLLRRRSPGVLIGSFGTTAFDLAVLGAAFKAIGVSPPIGVLVLGYLIGMLGGNVPVPGGIGGVDGGLIVTLTLFHEPLAATTVAVLTYHAIALWVPAVVGSVAFVRLRKTLQRDERPAAICIPLAESIEATPLRTAVPEAG
ncbi:MAG TPA: lysylphosphatidylglycerol synthase transmembrane domain-containing protein [Solirubrobacteraceae bacterium]|nr:lysylphosphatidylglycerol synthase transmembrane domain-containing protein [Solirubrobacteraceae bacterium]